MGRKLKQWVEGDAKASSIHTLLVLITGVEVAGRYFPWCACEVWVVVVFTFRQHLGMYIGTVATREAGLASRVFLKILQEALFSRQFCSWRLLTCSLGLLLSIVCNNSFLGSLVSVDCDLVCNVGLISCDVADVAQYVTRRIGYVVLWSWVCRLNGCACRVLTLSRSRSFLFFRRLQCVGFGWDPSCISL